MIHMVRVSIMRHRYAGSHSGKEQSSTLSNGRKKMTPGSESRGSADLAPAGIADDREFMLSRRDAASHRQPYQSCMTTMNRHEHWQQVYQSKSDTDVSWYQRDPKPSLTLIDRCQLDKDASIIDIGGGASRIVDALLDRGFSNITVLDISETALERARARLGSRAGGVTWIIADVTDWTPGRTYDLWHDRAAFHFLTEEDDRLRYHEAIRSALPEGGIAIIGTFALDGPERCSGLPVLRYEPATLAGELGGAFRLLDSLDDPHETPGGKIQKFQFSRFVRI